jgi:hypothetical protein
MKLLFTIILLLFLQSVSAQALRLYYTDEMEQGKANASTLRIKDSIRLKLTPGLYTIYLIRPNDYIHISYTLECTGNLTVPFIPEKGYFDEVLWLYAHSGIHSKWYKIVYTKKSKRYDSRI